MSHVSNLLRGDGFWMVPKALFAVLDDLTTSVYLMDMITREAHWRKRGRLDSEGFFYVSAESIEAELKIKKDRRIAMQKDLIKRGFLLVKRAGNPARNFYKVNHEAIEQALSRVDGDDIESKYDSDGDFNCLQFEQGESSDFEKREIKISEKSKSRVLGNRPLDVCESEVSVSNIIRTKNKNLLAKKPKAPSNEVAHVEGANLLIAHYCEEYKIRYKASPPITGRAAGIIKTTLKEFGLEKAKAMISAYLSMADSWFLTKSHDLETFRNNLNKVSQFMQNGVQVSRADIRQHELASHNQAVIDRFLARRGSDEG